MGLWIKVGGSVLNRDMITRVEASTDCLRVHVMGQTHPFTFREEEEVALRAAFAEIGVELPERVTVKMEVRPQ